MLVKLYGIMLAKVFAAIQSVQYCYHTGHVFIVVNYYIQLRVLEILHSQHLHAPIHLKDFLLILCFIDPVTQPLNVFAYYIVLSVQTAVNYCCYYEIS